MRRRKLVVTAVFSLSILISQARAGQLEDMQRQMMDLQSTIHDLLAKQRSLERQLQHETQERQAKQEQFEKGQQHEAQERQVKEQQLEKEQNQVKEQASSGFFAKGDFPGSFKIPSTNTSLRIGGYAKLDIIHDFNAFQGDFVSFPAIPLNGTVAARRQGSTRLDARQSRVNIETRTPTAYGTARTLIEGDFEGVGGNVFASNSTVLRLRHAFGELGPVLAGQTWSNFMDVESLPEVVDFNGPAGQIFIRQGQLRYTHHLAPETRISVAVENPEGDFFGPGANTLGNPPSSGAAAPGANSNALNQYPDFTARFVTDEPWGHFALAGLARQIQANLLTTGQHADDFGYGLSIGGIINTFGRDKIFYQLNGGSGIGRYLQDGVGSGAAFNGTSILNSQPAIGGFGGYQHWWTETLRSTAVYGHDEFYNDTSVIGLTHNRSIDSVHINIFWSPIESTNIGLEYIYGRRETDQHQHGEFNRLQAGFQYNFF